MTKLERGPLSPGLRLTKTEEHQVRSRLEKPDKELGYIDYFRSNSDQREALVADPFLAANGELIREKFDEEKVWPVLRAAILAEPDGLYERDYGKLSRKEKIQKLYEQIDVSAEMTVRLQRYIESHLSKLDQISDEELYKKLCREAFATADEAKVQSQYALSQRRGFRLSIANFLEARNKLSVYRREAEADAKVFAEKYLKQQFTGKVTIECLPIGLIIYLDEQDYALLEVDEQSIESITSAGVILFSEWLPQKLQGKIILLNRGGKQSGVETKQELRHTRGHEIRHAIFKEFHEQQGEISLDDTNDDLTRCQTEKDYQEASSRIFKGLIEGGKDEIIAYFSEGKFDESYAALGIRHYQWYLEEVEEALQQKVDLSTEAREKILDYFKNDQKKCFAALKKIRIIAERMYRQPDNRLMQKMLRKLKLSKDSVQDQNDIAEALLRNTPGTKVHLLAKYAGLTVEEARGDKLVKEKDQEALAELARLPDPPDRYEGEWWDKASQARDQLQQWLPAEALPLLLGALIKWSEKDWTSFWTEEAVLLIEGHVEIYGATEENRQEIKNTLGELIRDREKTDGFKETIKSAKQLLEKLNLSEQSF